MSEKTIHILLAEDERTLAMIIKDTLDGQGFHVDVAGDGEEALRLYAANKPDVLVADVMMPRLDGRPNNARHLPDRPLGGQRCGARL